MNQPAVRYAPGSLVKARGREWIVLPGSEGEILRLRPLSGSEEDAAVVHVGLETGIEAARFPLPEPTPEAGQDAALLLRDALLLSLRRGAGPFRSFGNIAVEPRTYQLVPLLMALRLEPVRLLIADDVGIGKTIEACLIAREMIDRGEIRRFAVLCPPHLVDQWVGELAQRFHINATAVTAGSAARLERGLPLNESIFSVHAFTVVSLDYIKSDRRRHDFIRACPEFVIVDEAHTCTNTGRGRHQRYELLRALADDAGRHLVLLTATPHSGDETAFFHLLGLLDREFERLQELTGDARERLRQRLAGHLVQRQRPDINRWMDSRVFPDRQVAELTYRLTGPWDRLFEDVLDYCATVTRAAGEDARRQRLTFWGTLALMRCVSSSPAAAAQALRTRMRTDVEPADLDEEIEDSLYDGTADRLPDDDLEPGVATADPALQRLVEQAERLSGETGDPKLALLIQHVGQLLRDGFNPVVFCRYIATAHYLHEHLQSRFRDVAVELVTGELPAEERVARVDVLAQEPRRLLVATDCLSEGVNLQHGHDAVVHYDLSWNPTRHEQREGRVDRFGQPREVVRATILYGENNPVDGAVLQVILRKAEKIRKELGVPVPLPDDEHTLTRALMQAVLLRGGGAGRQAAFDFDPTTLDEAKALDVRWTSLAERAKQNRTVFAQRALRPEEVLPEWQRSRLVLGDQADVQRFVGRALGRLGAGLDRDRRAWKAPLRALPAPLRERLALASLAEDIRIDFALPPASNSRFVHRTHPLVAILAEDLLERALGSGGAADGLGRLGRIGAWRSPAVQQLTCVLLLRLRHQLDTRRADGLRTLLVEEALPVASVGRNDPVLQIGPEVLTILDTPAEGTLPENVRAREIAALIDGLPAWQPRLESLADSQAEALLADHRRVREAARARGQYAVRALKPVDVVAAFVLLPSA